MNTRFSSLLGSLGLRDLLIYVWINTVLRGSVTKEVGVTGLTELGTGRTVKKVDGTEDKVLPDKEEVLSVCGVVDPVSEHVDNPRTQGPR